MAVGALGCNGVRLDAVGVPPSDLARGLIGHWSFDQGSGTVVDDESGNGHDGQLTGGTWISDGRFGGGMRLAAGDWVAVPEFPTATPNWTVSIWMRLSAEQLAADNEMWTTLITTENVGAGGWQFNLERPMGQPRFGFAYWAPAPIGTLLTKCACVETDAWIHLVGVVDVDRHVVTLFHNGMAADQQPWRTDIVPGDSTLYIGRWNLNGRLLNGDVDDIAIWARALTAPEVAALSPRAPP